MAAKQRHNIRSAKFNHGRDIMRPIISSDVMGNRNVEIMPVGAWVEPVYDEGQPDAVLAAQLEEEKIRKIKHEKANRLQSFRRQVKKRVSHASQVKRQQQIHEAEKAFELERKVIQQSYEMGTSTRKDTCSLRNDDLEHAIRLRLLKKYGEDVDEWENERQQESSNEKENLKVTDKARQQLMSKKIFPKSSQSSQLKTLKGQHDTIKVNRDIQSPIVTTVVEPDVLPATSNGYNKGPEYSDNDDDNDSEFNDEDDEENNNVGDDFISDCDDENDNEPKSVADGKMKPTVQFSDDKQVKKSRHTKRPASSKRPTSAQLAAMLSQFTESEALARQKRQQAAISRRIFMDREREAVRENLRRQEHRKRIMSLKKEKEAYRQELEALSQKEVEVSMRESYTVDEDDNDEDDEELRQRLEAVHFQEMVERRKKHLKKNREMERYLDALRHKLVEKARRLGISLPALCACGDIWDTHPETCANNCFFYKNNRAYARALQSLLGSTEVM